MLLLPSRILNVFGDDLVEVLRAVLVSSTSKPGDHAWRSESGPGLAFH